MAASPAGHAPGVARPAGADEPAPSADPPDAGLTRLRGRWIAVACAAVLAAGVLGVAIGAVSLPPLDVLRTLLGLDTGLSAQDTAIIRELRLPRVVLGLLVGATLASCGAAYQSTFGNPLADPYLLGAAAGAGMGATLAIVLSSGNSTTRWFVPAAAFAGALAAVAMAYVLGAAGGRTRSVASLILAGVAVAAFFTALQTYVQQRNVDTIRQVYSWILGRLFAAGWAEVALMLPYFAVMATVLMSHRWALDTLSVGDDEAGALGLNVRRTRLLIVVVASLGTAAAVAVSGLIAFVGIIVPHTIRLIFGSSYRVVLPLSLLFGGAFLVLADLLARTVIAPAELPIGVVTAFFGAPFFALVLHTSRGQLG